MRWVKSPFALLVAVLGFGVISCSDSAASRSLSPTSKSLSPDLNQASTDADLDQEVTGGVTFTVPDAPGVNTVAKYEMAAIRHQGVVKGELVLRFSRDVEQFVWGDIVCFSTVGNTAFLAARTRKSNVAAPGTYFAWTVTDNGEGKKSAPDQTSTFFLVNEALAQLHCANGGLNPPLFPVEHGNIQVHKTH